MAQFRTKARAVDHLGKGQIADLPTAVSELWKNGYDAGAKKLEGFLYLKGYLDTSNPIFVISDDGSGMTSGDILDKWLVLGTDAKARGVGLEGRIRMGEKGIGRLSVAYLGSPMLMLSKVQNGDIQLLYFDWRILENWELFLEEISIPIKTLKNIGDFPIVFKQLQLELKENFQLVNRTVVDNNEEKNLKIDPWDNQKELKNEICKDLEKVQFTLYFNDEILTFEKNQGTKFVIFNPNEQLLLLEHTDKREGNDEAQGANSVIMDIRRDLTGLANVFKDTKPSFESSFWIKRSGGAYDIISQRDFFSNKDFEVCDHLIKGQFDNEGKFTGTIRVYKEIFTDYTFHSTKLKKNERSNYGAFEICLGYMQGREKQSLLSEEAYKAFENKLKPYGGLYIYRDDFRVLPYGRTEYDFLDFEGRRGKSAGSYFFAHRRMFGYIAITRKNNEKLIDKAGREGFMTNSAYRAFKEDLIAFFEDLAKIYFATNALNTAKKDQQAEMANKVGVAQKEEERIKEERIKFNEKITNNNKELKKIESKIGGLIAELNTKLSQSVILYTDIESIRKELEATKLEYKKLYLLEPLRLQINTSLKNRLVSYQKEHENVQNSLLAEATQLEAQLLLRLQDAERIKNYNDTFERYKNSVSDMVNEYQQRLSQRFKELNNIFIEDKSGFVSDLQHDYRHLFPTSSTAESVNQSLKELEQIFEQIQGRVNNRYEHFIEHLEKLTLDLNEDYLIGYLKQQYQEILAKWQATQELAQLGIAVEIIDHQFNVLYSQMAVIIKSFDQFDDKKGTLFSKNLLLLKQAFNHLEQNYKLLTPLYRTTGRTRRDITGLEIRNYIRQFYDEQLKEREIQLESTPQFDAFKINTYESILKPVVVNVINNALYWLNSVRKRKILFDVDGDKILIMNSGTPIEDKYLEQIFELFYSRRPQGRGIGLFIARESLRSINLDIIATNEPRFNRLGGACFIIQPYQKT